MREVFPIAPASGGPLWFLGVMSVVLLGLVALFGWLAWASRNASVEVSPDALRVAGVLYGRTIPLSHLRVGEAAIVDATRGENRLSLRTNGAGLPGFAAGWFRTKKGEKVLAFVTRGERVAYVPTTDGYALMVSVTDPDALLSALRGARDL